MPAKPRGPRDRQQRRSTPASPTPATHHRRPERRHHPARGRWRHRLGQRQRTGAAWDRHTGGVGQHTRGLPQALCADLPQSPSRSRPAVSAGSTGRGHGIRRFAAGPDAQGRSRLPAQHPGAGPAAGRRRHGLSRADPGRPDRSLQCRTALRAHLCRQSRAGAHLPAVRPALRESEPGLPGHDGPDARGGAGQIGLRTRRARWRRGQGGRGGQAERGPDHHPARGRAAARRRRRQVRHRRRPADRHAGRAVHAVHLHRPGKAQARRGSPAAERGTFLQGVPAGARADGAVRRRIAARAGYQ